VKCNLHDIFDLKLQVIKNSETTSPCSFVPREEQTKVLPSPVAMHSSIIASTLAPSLHVNEINPVAFL